MQITVEVIETLTDFQRNADPAAFERIFGKAGTHLWHKFTLECEYNLLAFCRKLDTHHLNLLAHALSGGK